MKRFALFSVFCLSLSVYAQDQKQNQKPATLKGILLEQLQHHPQRQGLVRGCQYRSRRTYTRPGEVERQER